MNLSARISLLIQGLWEESTTSPAYREVMRAILRLSADKDAGEPGPISHWAQLPGLCCQAAGGEPEWADRLAAAWLLLYTAAHLMDSVEDQDDVAEWWAELGPGSAINAATGFYFSASLLLRDLEARPQNGHLTSEIVGDIYQSFLRICDGQHLDLAQKERDLDRYWQITAGKSGEFFALACRSGARLASCSPQVVEAYSRFGQHLGFLVQILDDLESVQAGWQGHSASKWNDLRRSLPFVYALNVAPPEQKVPLEQHLDLAASDPASAQAAFELIETCGAALYMGVEMERHHQLALDALVHANPHPPAREELAALLHTLHR